VGQTFSRVGSLDPCLGPNGKHKFRLGRQLRGYGKEDPPPDCVKPIPMPILLHVMNTANTGASLKAQAIVDLIAGGFFFLFRPGEHTYPKGDTAPFLLHDIHFYVGLRCICTNHAMPSDLCNASFITFTFRDQKNAVRNEVIGLSCSGSVSFCPVWSTTQWMRHLLNHNTQPTTPYYSVFENGRWTQVTADNLTRTLRHAVDTVGPTYGITSNEVSTHSLQTSGAMALLCSHVDADTICLIGRWKSDAMYRYLMVQAALIMRDFAQRMVSGGHYNLLPGDHVPVS